MTHLSLHRSLHPALQFAIVTHPYVVILRKAQNLRICLPSIPAPR
jgi:hypothetical protein